VKTSWLRETEFLERTERVGGEKENERKCWLKAQNWCGTNRRNCSGKIVCGNDGRIEREFMKKRERVGGKEKERKGREEKKEKTEQDFVYKKMTSSDRGEIRNSW